MVSATRRESVFLLLCVVQCVVSFSSGETYVIDDTGGHGRRFDGVGAISGGGATSKLLVNYPEPQRTEILDYLFEPNYGASLHILKVEIGGDVQSTDGTEASHMHNSWDENYYRGYEWWLMTEAKRRNPDILIYALPWAFPGWVGNGTESPYTNVNVTADYVLRWIHGCRTYHNITVNYIGIWNEKRYNTDYILALRRTLDAGGFQTVKIVASDNKWEIADGILQNPELAHAVDYIGVHYPNTKSPDVALETGKQLWASEDGTPNQAQRLNQNYVNGFMTATIAWNLISAYYTALPFPQSGLMAATQPWSGYYDVKADIWLTAHTTQFTKPGWKYLNHMKGVGKLQMGGSYVSLTDGNGGVSVVIETTSSEGQRSNISSSFVENKTNVTFIFRGSFSSLTSLNVFHTNLNPANGDVVLFEKLDPVSVHDRAITLELGTDEVYTLTTVATGNKGTSPQPPSPKPFPLPYSDNFETYSLNSEPYNFAQQVGSFEVVQSEDPERGKILRQIVLDSPINWCPFIDLEFPLNVIGSYEWADVFVQVDVRVDAVNGSGSAFVASHIDQGGCQVFAAKGIYFFLFPGQQKYVVANDLSRSIPLTSGTVSADPGWNRIGLKTFNGISQGYLNGQLLFNITAPDYPNHGFVGIGSSSYGITDFDNFNVSSALEQTLDSQGLAGKARDGNVLYFLSDQGD